MGEGHLDLFKILGKIAVDGVDKANKDLTSTTDTAKKTTSAFDKVGKSITNAFKKAKFEATGLSLERLTTRVTTQQNKVELLKRKYADLVLQHKKLSPEAIKTATEIRKLSSAMEKNKGKISKAEEAADKFDKSIKKAGDDSEETAEKSSSAFSKLASGAGKVLVAGVSAASAAIVALGKNSIENYANYEQLVGGVETLFGAGGASLQEYADSVGKSVSDAQREYRIMIDAQKAVFENANNAYKTAGLSANEYMETVTSFSASLIQSLGGDTRAAAQYADMAITDMADNANKMGTDMESIQNAYQGFAKQNYTMLDNLKLGYGGTKEEMERLLQDAEKLSGVEYDISSYADIVDAIHVVQTEMGITGTTAKEASTTIQGSVSSMKGAWQNFVTGLADENADMDQLMGNLIDSVVTVGDNLIPRIQTLLPRIATGLTTLASSVAQQLPGIMQTVVPSLLTSAADLVVALVQGIVDVLPMLIPVAVEAILTITTGLLEMLPEITQAAIEILAELATGLAEALPELIPTVVSIILEMATTLTDPGNLSMLINSAVSIIIALANGLVAALPQLIAQAPVIISNLVTAIVENVPQLLMAALEIIVTLVTGIGENLGQMGEAAGEIINSLLEGVGGLFDSVVSLGSQIVDKIKEGISAAWEGLVSFFTGLWDSLFGNRTVNVSASASGTAVNGSHAGGLDYVPFDGYIAELHKGEMVVPAAESNFLRSGGITAATEKQNAAIVGLLGQILDAVRDVDMDGMTIDLNRREFGRLVRAVT